VNLKRYNLAGFIYWDIAVFPMLVGSKLLILGFLAILVEWALLFSMPQTARWYDFPFTWYEPFFANFSFIFAIKIQFCLQYKSFSGGSGSKFSSWIRRWPLRYSRQNFWSKETYQSLQSTKFVEILAFKVIILYKIYNQNFKCVFLKTMLFESSILNANISANFVLRRLHEVSFDQKFYLV